MILDKRASDKLPSRITDIDREKIRRGKSLVSMDQRISRNGHRGGTIWITGLHGSGKNDLAYTLEKHLFDLGASVVLLDGSTVRSGLSRELDYSPADRAEHLRRVAHIARILNDQGIITICSFISPSDNIRNQVREIIGSEQFVLVYMNEEIGYCRTNKPQLYEDASKGRISNIPGVDMAYDIPEKPDFVINHKIIENQIFDIIRAISTTLSIL
jgi:bifunctional enzyme CysN/CysC